MKRTISEENDEQEHYYFQMNLNFKSSILVDAIILENIALYIFSPDSIAVSICEDIVVEEQTASVTAESNTWTKLKKRNKAGSKTSKHRLFDIYVCVCRMARRRIEF